MRIAYISFEYPPDNALGGIATYVQQAAYLMASRGHDVEVFAASALRAETEIQDKVRVHWCYESNPSRFRETVLAPFMERHQSRPFDVIEGPEYCADATCIKKQFPTLPLVVKMHTPSLLLAEICGLNPTPLSGGRYLKYVAGQMRIILGEMRRLHKPPVNQLFIDTWNRRNLIEQHHARHAEIVAAPCRDLMGYAASRWRIPESKIEHVPYPYQPTEAFLDIPCDTHTGCVGFLGRLERRKGVLDLAAAIPLVLKKYPSATFRFIGRPLPLGSEGKMADEVIREMLGGAATSVEFQGTVPLNSIPQELSKVDICVFPSIWENFPNVCLEAMAAGRGIIGSEAGGMAEMLAEGAGLLVPPENPAAIAEAIISLFLDPQKRIALGQQARHRLRQEYNGERIGDLMEDLYNKAISKRA